jgi:hypothetical protein
MKGVTGSVIHFSQDSAATIVEFVAIFVVIIMPLFIDMWVVNHSVSQ